MTWIRDFLRLAAWFPGLTTTAVVFSFSAALLEGLGLAALLPVIDESLRSTGGDAGRFARWLPVDTDDVMLAGILAFALLAASASLSRFTAEALLLRLRAAIERRAREHLNHALLHMSWPAFLSLRTGGVTQAQFTEGIQMGLGTQMLVQALGASLASAAYLAVAFAISARMTLYTLSFGLLVTVLYMTIGRSARRHSNEMAALASSIGARLAEVFQALKFIRATGMTSQVEVQTATLFDNWKRSYLASQSYAIALRHGFEILGLGFIAAFLLWSVSSGSEGLAAALVFLGVFYRLAPRMLAIQEGIFHARACHSWYVSWQSRLDAATAAPVAVSGQFPPIFRECIEFREVSYRYPNASRSAIERLSLSIRAGESVAIVGQSGSGKTTILDLLTGLLEPTTGIVSVDGHDLRSLDMQAWREGIGLVLQEPFLVHGTVLDNIAWGDGAPDVLRARYAAEQAGILPLIDSLPDGIASVLGERGGRLSGGQRQRVTIARALYREPRLLILDEPTSSLDSESQRDVLEALSSLKGGRTMVIVTHSEEVSALCDRVITLDKTVHVSTDHRARSRAAKRVPDVSAKARSD